MKLKVVDSRAHRPRWQRAINFPREEQIPKRAFPLRSVQIEIGVDRCDLMQSQPLVGGKQSNIREVGRKIRVLFDELRQQREIFAGRFQESDSSVAYQLEEVGLCIAAEIEQVYNLRADCLIVGRQALEPQAGLLKVAACEIA